MRNSSDQRIRIVMGGDPAENDAVLLEAGLPAPARGHVVVFNAAQHAFGCPCCGRRSGAAAALAGLYRARAVGDAPMFSGVVVLASPGGEEAVARAVEDDLFARARYRLGSH